MLESRSIAHISFIDNVVFIYRKHTCFYLYYLAEFYTLLIPTNIKIFDKFNFHNWSGLYECSKFNFLSPLLYIKTFRVIFKGKGYRVRIFRHERKVTLNFGHSHWTKLKVFLPWYFFKLRRQSYVFMSTSIKGVFTFYRDISEIRKLNRYTQRGLRLKSQAIKRRFGKISQYVSSLH